MNANALCSECAASHTVEHKRWNTQKHNASLALFASLVFVTFLVNLMVPKEDHHHPMSALEIKWLFAGCLGGGLFMMALLMKLAALSVAFNYFIGYGLYTVFIVPHYGISTSLFIGYWLPSTAVYLVCSVYMDCLPFFIFPDRPARHYQLLPPMPQPPPPRHISDY